MAGTDPTRSEVQSSPVKANNPVKGHQSNGDLYTDNAKAEQSSIPEMPMLKQAEAFPEECTKDLIKVIPQPTTDPLDPLNWKKSQKNVILAIVMFNYFILAYATTLSVPGFQVLQDRFGLSFDQVTTWLNVASLGMIIGPLILTGISEIYGRRSVQIVCTAIALISTVGVATARTWGGYLVARAFQGFGTSPATTVGIAAVNDLYFDYERGSALGLWMMSANIGFFMAPLLGGVLVRRIGPNWDSWLSAILFGILLLLQLFFMPETLYPRRVILSAMQEKQDAGFTDQETITEEKGQFDEVNIKRTKELPFLNFRKIQGLNHPKLWSTAVECVLTLRLYAVLVCLFLSNWLVYSWQAAVMSCFPIVYGKETEIVQGLVYVPMMLGTVIMEALCSGRLSDWIVVKLAKRNNNVREPEMRIWIFYPGLIIMAGGLVLWGITTEKKMHWFIAHVALFLVGGGSQLCITGGITYCIDAYPEQSTSILTFNEVFVSIGAFIVPIAVVPWMKASLMWMYITQGIIVAAGVLPAFVLLHVFGAKLRAISPQPSWVNPEYDTADS